MYRLWIHLEELDEGGEPVGEPLEPLDLGDFADLAEAEDLLSRVADLAQAAFTGAPEGEEDRAPATKVADPARSP